LSNLFCGSVQINDNGSLDQESNAGTGPRLFKIELGKYCDSIPVISNYLDADEMLRANKYRFLKDKNRFIICRGFLKILLAESTDFNPKDIRIGVGPNKKPFLPSHPSIFFNVSHSGEYALIAIGGKHVGVDVEKVDRAFDFSEISPRIFNSAELEKLDYDSDTKKQFFKFWTRKEAILKATGKGIDDDLVNIPVTDGFHSLESGILGDFSDWVVLSFDVDAHHMGALAFKGQKDEYHPNPFFTPLPVF
jgi:4'-phosphopantetheinyl transferase